MKVALAGAVLIASFIAQHSQRDAADPSTPAASSTPAAMDAAISSSMIEEAAKREVAAESWRQQVKKSAPVVKKSAPVVEKSASAVEKSASAVEKSAPAVENSSPPAVNVKSIVWFAPFYSQSGYGSEARAYVLGLDALFGIRIVQHGDSYSSTLVHGLDPKEKRRFSAMEDTRINLSESVVICHSEPGAWNPPRWPTSLCPPPQGPRPALRVGRTMFETDRIPSGWELRLNKMDEAVEIFAAGGVKRHKLKRIPEPVDVNFFNPEHVTPLNLKWRQKVSGTSASVRHERAGYAFLSIFKWEERKGWDVLLEAYFEEFTSDDDVSLHILTHGYHSTKSESVAVAEFVEARGYDRSRLPKLQLISEHIPTSDLPRLYKACDAFVLPSRGEGWGRPHVEAMSMGLPLISTNWSGPTEFMTVHNSLPLQIEEELVPLPEDSAFAGHLWAQPSVTHLRKLMRKLVNEPELGVKLGKQARQDMVDQYAPDVIAKLIAEHIKTTSYEHLQNTAMCTWGPCSAEDRRAELQQAAEDRARQEAADAEYHQRARQEAADAAELQRAWEEKPEFKPAGRQAMLRRQMLTELAEQVLAGTADIEDIAEASPAIDAADVAVAAEVAEAAEAAEAADAAAEAELQQAMDETPAKRQKMLAEAVAVAEVEMRQALEDQRQLMEEIEQDAEEAEGTEEIDEAQKAEMLEEMQRQFMEELEKEVKEEEMLGE